jgi:hypothetical protein
MESRTYASDAWLLQGMTVSVPGWLDLRDGRLSFVTPDSVVFDVALSDVSAVVFPWYYFGGGVKLTAAGEPYRLSFVKPNGAEYAAARGLASLGEPAALAFAASKLGDVGSGQEVGRLWRQLLEASTTA